MLARGDVNVAKEWAKFEEQPKDASARLEVPEVTDDLLQGTALDCNSRKTENGANGHSVAQNSNVCNRSKAFACLMPIT